MREFPEDSKREENGLFNTENVSFALIPMHGEKNVARGFQAAQKELGAGVDGC